MSSTSLFSPKIECGFFGFSELQQGFWYDYKLRELIKGQIVDFKLVGKIVHDGTDSDKGKFLCAFNEGYHYNNWDTSSVVYFPENILKYEGFMNWLQDSKTNEFKIKMYFECKWMLEKLNSKTK